MIFFHFFTLSLYATYIVDCMYTHINIELVLKATRANKELYLSSLVASPRKKCKQDIVNHSFTIYYSFSMHMAWHLAWKAAPLVSFVGLL